MRRHGFTLIEMLTVVAIFGVVAMYVGRILIVNERAYHTVEEHERVAAEPARVR